MSPESSDWWERAKQAADAAGLLVDADPNGAASRAYFAAFAAVTALFSSRGREFRKHSGVRAAVHRDLIQSGEWPADLGADYSRLFDLRQTADNGGSVHVSPKEAREAVERTRRILRAVETLLPK